MGGFDGVTRFHIQLMPHIFEHLVVLLVHRAIEYRNLRHPILLRDVHRMPGKVECLVLGQEELFLEVLALHRAVQLEQHALAFLWVLADFVIDTQVVAVVILVQRVTFNVQVTRFKGGHRRISSTSQIGDARCCRADARAGAALDDGFDVRE